MRRSPCGPCIGSLRRPVASRTGTAEEMRSDGKTPRRFRIEVLQSQAWDFAKRLRAGDVGGDRVISRWRVLLLSAALLAATVAAARLPAASVSDWAGSYAGTVAFSHSFPPRDEFSLQDVDDPPPGPPIRAEIMVAASPNGSTVWMSIAGGAMRTTSEGETLRFGPLSADGRASLTGSPDAAPIRQRRLRIDNGKLFTEVELRHADETVWWRYVTLMPTEHGMRLIVWVFDRNCTGTRSWSGELDHQR